MSEVAPLIVRERAAAGQTSTIHCTVGVRIAAGGGGETGDPVQRSMFD